MREIQGSFVPIYFIGALIFLLGGILLIYYNHPIIGGVAIIPGIILLVLTVLAKVASRIFQEAIKKEQDKLLRQNDLLRQASSDKEIFPE